ncbi:ImmA/IrrE family metallo-endopeptidase [Pseudomonas protegens]|uniref:ImmA/IrrE family metallo-endopeptidase n=1 Tax=Pseudomonas protegens TaxID=380021 RepID=UPI001C69823B|nr:ImmA/IrrE family metallo-endopeptidase [Pseudomonas protegens]QYN02762.1 ImmA/IrrE family metallo-endopeptidase [Pseudomonas protegens]
MSIFLASNALNEHWNGYLPVDPIHIANQYGIAVFPEEELNDVGASGDCYFDSKGRPVIRYNPREPQTRQRFTIAHELGHLLMGHIRPGQRAHRDPMRSYDAYHERPMERQANEFAAQLLMPESVVRMAAKSNPNTQDLARNFNVSADAMGYRIRNLGIIAW